MAYRFSAPKLTQARPVGTSSTIAGPGGGKYTKNVAHHLLPGDSVVMFLSEILLFRVVKSDGKSEADGVIELRTHINI